MMSPEERVLLEADHDLDFSINGLCQAHPELSAQRTLTRGGRRVVVGLMAALVTALAAAPLSTLIALNAIVICVYVATLVHRLVLFRRAVHAPAMLRISDDDARRIPEGDLPVYSILVPAYREPKVVATLLAAIDRFEYPQVRLDVKVLLEADDDETAAAVTEYQPGDHVEIVVVPTAGPRTKPKACNYGLCRARGEYVTIYDADDVPEPLQLRRAVVAFRRIEPEVACLQARLAFYNQGVNRLTRWFQLEYATWFSHFLPSLVEQDAPLPLGGTSNHFKRAALIAAGAWDAHNVTEDADLGVRMHRLGYRVRVLDSVTEEEANGDFVNWVQQRSRWHKGYLQTWLVHVRHPLRLRRELGTSGFVTFNLFVGGTPVLALVNPLLWLMTIWWFVSKPGWIVALFPAPLYCVAVCCLVLGNLTCIYLNVVTARLAGHPELVGTALLTPVYWLMMSVAAVKAAWQLASKPQFWEKTVHGLQMHPQSAPEVALR
jgi:cellulose synthase/poly-beta-1,6-N-acetylglucosamine synthase-like glycosyltransferase